MSVDTTFFKDRLERFQQAGERYASECEQNMEACQPISPALLQKGFPKRHVAQLGDGLQGPCLTRADELMSRVESGDALLILVGTRGPGKTQMATYWAGKLVLGGSNSVRYIKCADLIGEIKATWHDGGSKVGTEQDVLRKYRNVKYLVIDEFHERGGSDWESRCLVNLIDHRYDDMLATVLIANLSPDEAKKQINPSIIDRANQTGGLIVCDWKSYR